MYELYVKLQYATARWINGLVHYVIANTTIDSRDKWLGVGMSTWK